MKGSASRKTKSSSDRDSYVGQDGRTYKEFRFGKILPKPEPRDERGNTITNVTERERLMKLQPTLVQPFVEFRPVHGPRIPWDKLKRTRGRHRRIGLTP